jgi:hypothetical protein
MPTAVKKPKLTRKPLSKDMIAVALETADYLLVNVRASHFERAGGQYHDGTKCALALAIRGKCKSRDVLVSADCVFLGKWRWEFDQKAADLLWMYANLVRHGCKIKPNVVVQVKMKKVGLRSAA